MALTRKRKKEFRQLRSEADSLLQDQREVLDQASRVVREASRQAGNFAREEVAPRVRTTYDDRVRPALDTGISVTRSAAHTARDRIVGDVLPSVGSAIGSAVGVLEAATNSDVRDAIKSAAKSGGKKASDLGAQASKSATKLGVKAGVVKPKSSGPGKYILIGIAVVAVAGIAYAAWQTLRADDDLWIDDEIDESDVETPQD